MENFLKEEERERIKKAIELAEEKTSGELRVYIEAQCKGDALKSAQKIFHQLAMHKTELRSGVLIYVAHQSKQLAIVGDKGIHEHVKNEFWEEVKNMMLSFFKKNQYTEGIEKAITPKTKGVCLVHMCGGMADMDSIMKVVNDYNLILVEDAGQA